MKTLSRARQVGGSLVVTIPKEIVREENLRDGELVQIEIEKVAKSGFGILKGMRSFRAEDEMKAHDQIRH
jgi:antitoxin component of MazEF toxin-antitoxin module